MYKNLTLIILFSYIGKSYKHINNFFLVPNRSPKFWQPKLAGQKSKSLRRCVPRCAGPSALKFDISMVKSLGRATNQIPPPPVPLTITVQMEPFSLFPKSPRALKKSSPPPSAHPTAWPPDYSLSLSGSSLAGAAAALPLLETLPPPAHPIGPTATRPFPGALLLETPPLFLPLLETSEDSKATAVVLIADVFGTCFVSLRICFTLRSFGWDIDKLQVKAFLLQDLMRRIWGKTPCDGLFPSFFCYYLQTPLHPEIC